MPEFSYSARDEEGQTVKGKIEAADQNEAMRTLSSRFSVVTQLEETNKDQKILKFLNWISPVRGEDLLAFSRALAQMVDGGISLKRAMDILYQDIENPALRKVVAEVGSEISGGQSLSAAMAKHPLIFDRFFLAMVRAGESSGNLPEMLRRLGDYLEVTEGLKSKVKSALFYPFIVIVFAVIMISGILVFGVPYLENIYDGLGLQLPIYTRMVVLFGGLMARNLTALVILVIVLAYVSIRFIRQARGQEMLDHLRLKLPIFNTVFRLLYTARFSRTLATLYASGIPMLEALDLVKDTIGNRLVAEELQQAIEGVKGGQSISSCLRGSSNFSRMAVGMMAAGEESGSLDAMLNKIADFYEMKVYAALEGLASTLEPLLMVFVGLIIAAIILVMGLPFMNLASLL